ncbi:VOC family protein [Chryseolinea sp. H1M3-3]|uniref:bleomycin resistance protein n=1 Tax=Chryseolinea sp. H1M3-3 TaxID=3034144 RepID=UPI0023EB3DD5|nr:VOC family protein [Chryseolinea sp. H1M3-3]
MASFFNSVIPKLPSKDLAATKSFYIDKLNFRQVGADYPDYLMLYRDGIELHFFLNPDLEETANDGMCYIRVTQIDKLHAMLTLAGDIPCIGKLEPRPWGQKEFSLVDNNENQITFGEEIR